MLSREKKARLFKKRIYAYGPSSDQNNRASGREKESDTRNSPIPSITRFNRTEMRNRRLKYLIIF
jgi:hypothetical protein